MTHTLAAGDAAAPSIDHRKRTADRVFRGALVFNSALTAFWLFVAITHQGFGIFQNYAIDRSTFGRIASGILFFYVMWGFIWYGIKSLLLTYFVRFSKDERRQAFSSRMKAPFDVFDLHVSGTPNGESASPT